MARSRTSGQGRPRGVPNRLNADIKAMIVGALSDVGGRDYLAKRAIDTPAAFLTLIGKVLPMQIAGDGGGAVTIEVITGVPRADDAEEEESHNCDATHDAG